MTPLENMKRALKAALRERRAELRRETEAFKRLKTDEQWAQQLRHWESILPGDTHE